MAVFQDWFKRLLRKEGTSSPSQQFIERYFDIKVKKARHFELALTHRSSAQGEDNERLEFLGDAVLDLVVAEYLFRQFPQMDEGNLTKLKSKLISRSNLSRMAMDEGFTRELQLVKQRDLAPELIIGNVLEAIFGAIYLDQGYEVARSRTITMIERTCDMQEFARNIHDAKSSILEWSQKHKRQLGFNVVSTGDSMFEAQILIDGKPVAKGRGQSKKKAEKEAARIALSILDIE